MLFLRGGGGGGGGYNLHFCTCYHSLRIQSRRCFRHNNECSSFLSLKVSPHCLSKRTHIAPLVELLLYLDLYVHVRGDDSWISLGSFMRTKHLCGLIHIRIKGVVGTKAVLLLCTFLILCLSFLYCLVCAMQPCGHLLGNG